MIMEAKIYFLVKILCTVFLFYKLWTFIFSREMHDVWEKVCRMMRAVRIRLWKCRKGYRERKTKNARKNTKRNTAAAKIEVPQEMPETMVRSSSAEDNDVIGRTRIVYLEDPEEARKTPVHSEPLIKVPIEEDEEISPDDVESKGLTKEEMEELMAPVDAEPDPEFSTAMTYEEMSNVAEVLASETQDEQKSFRASMTIYHKLSGTEMLNLLEKENGCRQKIEYLLNEYLDESGRPLAKQKTAYKKVKAFDISKFV